MTLRTALIASVLSLTLTACAGARAVKPGASLHDCADCPELVVIPSGSFTMGSDRTERMRANEVRPEGPVRKVTIAKPFAIGKFEVTNRQFAAFVAATGYAAPASCQIAGTKDTPGKTWREPDYGRPPADDEPVVCVSWLDARAYAAWLSKISGHTYRLPTEAEWEYVGHAGTQSTFAWGEDEARACEFGNVFDESGRRDPRAATEGAGAADRGVAPCDDGYPGVAPVGRFKPNAFGVHDMLGNVWEWAQDCSLELYPAAPVDGSAVEVPGVCEKRAVRGGGWRTRLSRHRPTFRGRDPEATASNIFGFRVARDLD